MEKSKYLKHPENGRVLPWTRLLADRGDMIPCDADGNPLNEDCVMPGAEPFKMPDVIDSGVDGWGLGDPEKREAMEGQLNEKIKEGNEEWVGRNNASYDGVMGKLPDWIPERDRIRFGWESNLLLNQYSHEEIREYIELYPKYIEGKLDDLRFSQMQRELVQAIGLLFLIKQAIDAGPERGLKMLSGDHAARGFKMVLSGSEGGKTKGENFAKEKEDILKIAMQIKEKRSRMPSKLQLARLVVNEKYPDLKGEDAEKKADTIRHCL